MSIKKKVSCEMTNTDACMEQGGWKRKTAELVIKGGRGLNEGRG